VQDQEVGFDEFVIHEAQLLVLRKNAIKDAITRHGKKWRERAKKPERP
jgi:hypothetical protein